MSKNIQNNKYFLHLLLNSTKDQATALIDTITPEQVLLLSEIALNILELPLPKKAAFYVKKYKTLFRKLADKKVIKDTKQRLIRKNYKPLLMTLWSLKQQLSDLQ